MKKLQATDTGKGVMFQNAKLEKFTKTPVWFSIVFYSCIWFALIYLNSLHGSFNGLQVFWVYLGALFFWTLFEYLAHRYLFHFVNENPRVQKFHYMIHGIHHEFPRDEERLIMPPLPGLVLVCILTVLFSLIFHENVFLFMAGFLNGWAIYVSIHYIVHAFKPIKPFKILWTHHAKHHYKDGNKAYGVSSPFWDIVFRTMPD